MIDILRKKNNSLEIFDIYDNEFKKYGNIIDDIDFTEIINYVENNAQISEGITYERKIDDLQNNKIREIIEKNKYAEMSIQIGWCIGKNSTMNGLEYHKGNEIIVACTDLCLFLGYTGYIKENNYYDSKDVKVFYMKKGVAIELFSTTMHLAPVQVSDSGFKAVIILPMGTNEPIDVEPYKKMTGEQRLIFARNKWMIAHADSGAAKRGAFVGIIGENPRLVY